jgi:hypothetical protein
VYPEEARNNMPPKRNQGATSESPPPWRNSRAKKLLERLLKDQSSWIHILTDEQIHDAEPLFKQYPFNNFKTNLNNMKEKLAQEAAAIEFDRVALDSDTAHFPRNPVTERGYKFWDGHEADKLLEDDVKEARSQGTKPRILHESRDEYKEFPLAVFRNHKYQAERKAREAVYWQKKRNDKARKQHAQDVEQMQENTNL